MRLLGCLREERLRCRTGIGRHLAAVLAGLIGVTVGAAALTAAPARAVDPPPTNGLGLTTASGATRAQPRWYTQDGCPGGFQGSAVLDELNADGSVGRSISPVVTDVRAPFGGTLLGSVGQLITDGADVGFGGTDEWMVACYSGPHGTGSSDDLGAVDVTLSWDGGSFWTRRPRPVATTTTLTAAPDPAAPGAAVTLTATVKAADGTVPRGEVAFLSGFSLISVAPVNASGVATATTSFAASGTNPRTVSLAAWFFGLFGSYAGSAGSCTETVNPSGTQAGGTGEPVTVTVPRRGVFTVTITPGTVILSAPNRMSAKGKLLNITVTDLRTERPGWSVSGQESAFTGTGVAAGGTISGNQLGWTPAIVSGNQRGGPPYLWWWWRRRGGVTPGPPVTPAHPGLGTTAAILASAEEGSGFGTYVLSASLVLDIPPATLGGPYGGSLTITAVEADP